MRILEHGVVGINEIGLNNCPECGHVPLYRDSRPAFSFETSGEGYAIVYCKVCHCVWVEGDVEKAKTAQRERCKRWILDDGTPVEPGDWERFKRRWGEDV